MRPTGIVLIAIYHFLAAALLVLAAIALMAGGSLLGGFIGAGRSSPIGGMGLGFLVGALGAAFVLVFAIIAALAGYGVWRCVSGDAFCALCWPSSRFCSPFPGCCFILVSSSAGGG